jgi:hypothetical protein
MANFLGVAAFDVPPKFYVGSSIFKNRSPSGYELFKSIMVQRTFSCCFRLKIGVFLLLLGACLHAMHCFGKKNPKVVVEK